MSHFQGRVAIVTGGVGTIGSECSRQLLDLGASVVLNGRNQERCEAAAAKLAAATGAGDRIMPLAADVSDLAQCIRLVEETERLFGRVDYIIHCALSPLAGLQGLFETTDPSLYQELMKQAVCAPMYLVHAALPALKRAGGGTILAFPSDSGKVAAPNQSMVGTTRAAVMMFMRSIAMELSAHAIRCNCIAPTYVDSPIMQSALAGTHGSRIAKATSRAKLGLPTAEELAALAVFLCGPGGKHLTGQVISVNGGLSAA
jgi:NAD(P)-dependent dehydrogenase (short-subunit alcohol dehydrogenase family)